MKEKNQDVPFEAVYKYLLRDYRELRKENTILKKRIKNLLVGIIDNDSEEFQKVIKERAAVYHCMVKKKLRARIEELEKEIETLKSKL